MEECVVKGGLFLGHKYCDRAFAYGAIGRLVYPSWITHSALSHYSQCSTAGDTKLPITYGYNMNLVIKVAKVSANDLVGTAFTSW